MKPFLLLTFALLTFARQPKLIMLSLGLSVLIQSLSGFCFKRALVVLGIFFEKGAPYLLIVSF